MSAVLLKRQAQADYSRAMVRALRRVEAVLGRLHPCPIREATTIEVLPDPDPLDGDE